MKTFAICLCLLLPVAAAAASSDAAKLQGCVQSSASGPQSGVLGKCVGMFQPSCKDDTTIGIAECMMREQRGWDELLNAWWTPMKARAQANGSWDSLLAAQRQWIKDRDAECARRYEEAGGGSIRVIYGAECQRDLTAARAVEFFYSLNR